MKKSLFLLLFLSSTYPTIAQKNQGKYNTDSVTMYSQKERYKMDSIKIGFLENNNDYSIHTINQRIWLANEKYSYFAFPFVLTKSLRHQNDLQIVEGRDGYVMEGNIDQRYTLLMGRNQANSLWQSQRLTFDFNLMLRMAKGNSNPLLPFNAKFGLGYDLKIWDNYSKFPFPITLKDSYINWLSIRDAKKPLVSYNLNLALHHYSNGQSDLNPEVNPNGRNNYISGNFSTNYFRAMVYRTRLGWKEDNYGYGKRDLLTLGIGYQADGQVGDESVFDYANSQDKRYGYNRLLGTVIIKKNYRVKRMISWAVQQNAESDCDCKKLKLGVNSRHEWTLRTDLEYIADKDLSKYVNPQNEKNRLAISTILNFTTYRFRTVGLFAKYYYGRDYLNIRYDDKIQSLIFGLTFAFDKYKEPLLGGDFIATKQRDPLKIIDCIDKDCK